jgi:nucleotide-binding universal stress UspA family protein
MKPQRPPYISHPGSILVATDLTDLSFLLPVAKQQARETGKMLWFLHVVTPDTHLTTELNTDLALQRNAFREVEAALAGVCFELKAEDFACDYEVSGWYPVDKILGVIRERQIERLIIGTSSKGKLEKLLVGSVAEQLIRNLDIPVCTVGPRSTVAPPAGTKRVLFASCLRHGVENSFQFASDLVTMLPAELTLLHVLEQSRFDDGIDLSVTSKIDEFVEIAKRRGFVPKVHFRYGDPAEEIVAECQALTPDLLVLGAEPASILSTNFRTGVVYKVIAQAPCPAFTIRNSEKAKLTAGTQVVSQAQRAF